MPVIIMAGRDDRIVDFAHQSEHLYEVLREATLIPFEGSGHMIHHVDPEKVVQGISMVVNRSSRMAEGHSSPAYLRAPANN